MIYERNIWHKDNFTVNCLSGQWFVAYKPVCKPLCIFKSDVNLGKNKLGLQFGIDFSALKIKLATTLNYRILQVILRTGSLSFKVAVTCKMDGEN